MEREVPLLAFAAVFGLLISGYLFHLARRSRAQDSLRRRLGAGLSDAALLRQDQETALDRLLRESGLGWSRSVLTMRVVAAAVVGILAGLILGGPFAAFAFGLIGAGAFPFYLRMARERRQELCDQQMPQALEIVQLALRAGHPLPTALAIAAGEAPSPIAEELKRACDEHDLGRPIGDVVVSLGARLPKSQSVHTFTTAVLVLQQTGGNLIQVIERIVENARARQQYYAKLRALTSEGRMSAKMLALMPLAFGAIAITIDPGYLRTLFTTSGGNMVLLLTAALWLGGIVWVTRLVKAEL